MFQHQMLSKREKVLSIAAGVLVVLLSAFGYVSAQTEVKTEVQANNDDLTNQNRWVSDQESYTKNLQREIEDIKRGVKTGLDTTAFDAALTQFTACIAARKAEAGTQDFWNKTRDCDDSRNAIEDQLRDSLRPQRDCAQKKQQVEDRRKEKKSNLDRQVKDILRNDKTADISALNTILSQIDALFVKADALTTCNQDASDQLNDITRDFDGLFRDAYDAANELNQKSNDARRLSENTKDFNSNLKRQCEKDFARELKNLDKEYTKYKTAGTVTADAETAYNKAKTIYNDLCVTLLQAMQTALNNKDVDAFEDARNSFNETNRDMWDSMNEARNFFNTQQQLKDITRELGNREKELVKMRKEYDRFVKKAGMENPEAKQILADYEALIAKAKEAVKADPQTFWQDYNQELNDLQNNFWQANQKSQSIGDVQRWMKDIERELKNREKDLANMKKDKGNPSDVLEELAGILSRMRGSFEKAKQIYTTDPDGARDTLQSIDDLRREWDDTTRFMFGKKELQFMLEKVNHELEFAVKRINEMKKFGKISGEEADSCLAFAEEVKQNVEKFKSGNVSQEEMEEFFNNLEDNGREVCPSLDKIGNAPPPDRAYYKEFIQQNVQGVNQDEAAAMLEKVSGDMVQKVLQRLLSDPSTVQQLLQAAGQNRIDVAAGTLESAANFYDDAAQRDLLAKKAEIIELTNQLDQLRSQVQIAADKLKEMQTLQNDILAYNFYGNAGDEIRNEMESFIAQAKQGGLSKDQMRVKIDELKTKKEKAVLDSKLAKLEAKVIPFLDTDDNVWYTKYVAPLAQLGIVRGKGDGRNFDPASNVTVAEVLTMAFRISGDREASGASALCGGKYASHWANNFVAWAENKGLSLVRACSDINRPAMRWEVAQALLETKEGSIPETDAQCFKDVKSTDKLVNAAVCEAQKQGVMSGSNGLSNAYNKIIRAEAATMVKQAAEKLFGVQFGGGGSGGQNKQKSGFSQPVPMKEAAPGEEEEEENFDEEW